MFGKLEAREGIFRMIWKEKVRSPVSWPGLGTPANDGIGNGDVQAAGGAPNGLSQGKGVLGRPSFSGFPGGPGAACVWLCPEPPSCSVGHCRPPLGRTFSPSPDSEEQAFKIGSLNFFLFFFNE